MQIPMAKVEIIGPKHLFFDAVSAIHRLGTVHIEDMSKKTLGEDALVQQMEVDSQHAHQKEELGNLLVRLNAILAELEAPDERISPKQKEKIYGEVWRESAEELAEEINSIILDIEQTTAELAARKNDIEAELSVLANYEPILEKIQPLAKQVVATEGFESIALLIQRKYKAGLETLKGELDKLTKKQCEVVSTDVDEETTAAIVIFNKIYSEQVHKFLAIENVNEVRLPTELADQPFDVAYDTVKRRSKELPKKLEEIKGEMKELSKKWYVKLYTIKSLLLDKLSQLEIIPKFGQTEYAFVITGWLPKKDFIQTEAAMREEFGTKIVVTRLKLSHKEWEEAPVKLVNPKWAEPFQFFYKLVKPPAYGTVDPTPFLAIYFPIMFGFIVGDAGYGLVMFILAWLLRKKLKDIVLAQVFTSILLIASTSAMFFGAFIFFEFFGTIQDIIIEHLGGHIPWHPFASIKFLAWWPIARAEVAHSLWPLLGGAITIGMVHLAIGFIFGTINGLHHGDMKHALEKAGFLSFLISIAIFLLTVGYNLIHEMPQVLPGFAVYIGVLFLVIGIVGVGYGGGVQGVMEIFGVISNIVSYARLVAVGLAGVIMAYAVNVLAMKMGEAMGAAGLIFGILLAVILHSLNIAVSVLSPSVHSLRLNLVECFSKFFHAAPAEYEPFRKIGGE